MCAEWRLFGNMMVHFWRGNTSLSSTFIISIFVLYHGFAFGKYTLLFLQKVHYSDEKLRPIYLERSRIEWIVRFTTRYFGLFSLFTLNVVCKLTHLIFMKRLVLVGTVTGVLESTFVLRSPRPFFCRTYIIILHTIRFASSPRKTSKRVSMRYTKISIVNLRSLAIF